MSQVPLRELLKDPIFRKWMAKPPSHPGPTRWRVWVRRKKKGPWGKIEFDTYAEAYRWMAKHLGEYQDMAVSCLKYPSKAPRIKVGGKIKDWPMPEGHGWCGFCRRPVIYAYFTKHHFWTMVGRKWAVNGTEKLCPICGARERFADTTRRRGS